MMKLRPHCTESLAPPLHEIFIIRQITRFRWINVFWELIDNLRPITLLNNEYKILTHIYANR